MHLSDILNSSLSCSVINTIRYKLLFPCQLIAFLFESIQNTWKFSVLNSWFHTFGKQLTINQNYHYFVETANEFKHDTFEEWNPGKGKD